MNAFTDALVRPTAVGIDPSANATGVVVLGAEGELLHASVIEPPMQGLERLAYIRDALDSILSLYPYLKIGVRESYSMRSVHRSFLLGEVGGIAQLAMYDHCSRVEEAAPAALKKFASSMSTATKDDMKTAVAQRWGVKFSDDNIADAYALARLGLGMLNPSLVQRRDQREVIANATAVKPKKKAPPKRSRGDV